MQLTYENSMSPNKLARPLFDLWGFNYSTSLAAHPGPDSLHADIMMLHDQRGLVAAIYPAGYIPDIKTLRQLFKRSDLSPVVTDGLYDMITPLKPDAIQLVVDENLIQEDESIYFSLPGTGNELILEEAQEQFLKHNSFFGSVFSMPQPTDRQEEETIVDSTPVNLLKRVTEIEELPAMPETAYHLLRLRNNPDATIEQLVTIIEQDAALAAQILRHANSAWYQSPQPAETLYDAVFRIIGFENAIYIALGSIIGQSFKLASSGPLGKEQQWKQSVYSATLSQKLAGLSKTEQPIKPGLAYLAGLLHNIGIMTMCQLFHTEYLWLNKTLSENPEIQIDELEKQQFGMNHGELGSLMLLDWCLPLAITITVLEHHNLEYQGPFEEYVHLIQVSNALLKSHELSDAINDELPYDKLTALGLEEEQLYEALDELLENSGELESMAMDMAS